ncbi:MarR family winged helix-turn-helix transcriptional regulator [Gordonia polyisoprenivorans]|uniref:MarR family winged helix-turn-helix transcriptional regulator n=1 Tax=Gordonia polyisoprenivorans TaxID=84595 RepID=UPI001AD6B40C|nr:MarR family transcriptional regulator [Gordonia polyisoprenivorans]QTI67555.1 MarR family transcriptional regulator [Gordonia polyisoprenivorans]
MPSSNATLLYLVKQLELAVRARMDEVVGGEGLTPVQYTALTVLARRPGLTSAELARNSFVRPQTMARITAGLEERQFVRRETDPHSRRQMRLYLTDHGHETVERLEPAITAIETRMVADLDDTEVEALRSALQSSRRALGGSAAQ